MSRPIVHLIDDDDDVRESLAFLLSTADIDVQTYEAAQAFLNIAAEAEGCVITDVRMPGMDGMELTRRLKTMGVRLPIIVITGHGDVPLAIEAMRIGVNDFIEKPFNDEVILTAVERALKVGTDPQGPEGAAFAQRIAELSPRERQVLDGLVQGKANKVIARDLDISPRTVEIYRAHVKTKTQAQSLSELVRMAILAGIA